MLTAEIMNWTGIVIAAPRSGLAELFKRDEVKRTGIYLLIGDNPDDPTSAMIYIGEGDKVGARLYKHSLPADQGGKDFWHRAVVLTSKDTNFTKAHARYLESQLIRLAKAAGRSTVMNTNAPDLIRLPEGDLSDMEHLIDRAKLIFPILGIDSFRATPGGKPVTASSSTEIVDEFTGQTSPVFEMKLRVDDIVAQAQEVDGEFVVLQGSHARSAWKGKDHAYRKLYDKLVSDPNPRIRCATRAVRW
jgi:hypothetical protein